MFQLIDNEHSSWDSELTTHPTRPFTSIELFAGAGGLALGMERAGFQHLLLNEFVHDACNTLRQNRPQWNVLEAGIQEAYMAGSLHLPGGKTGIARRLSLDEPSLTLTCAPAQKQTERCHPTETRPLTIREYARIQTFPDDWVFMGSMTSQYKQIGNAVPVNLAHAMGRALVRLLNRLEEV